VAYQHEEARRFSAWEWRGELKIPIRPSLRMTGRSNWPTRSTPRPGINGSGVAWEVYPVTIELAINSCVSACMGCGCESSPAA
jgi:hypothetical protein